MAAKADEEPLPTLTICSVNVSRKYLALGVLVIQTSSLVLLLRYSRTAQDGHDIYLSSTAVFLAEVVKMLVCLLVILKELQFDLKQLCLTVYTEVWLKPAETLKMSIPAGLYTVQNNLLYMALSNLDAATYQVTYQLKILTTALFSVLLLGRRLNRLKWLSLVILMFGVILVQWKSDMENTNENVEQANLSKSIVGLICVLCACFSSGFAGVYFEKVLKSSRSSLWVRNVQLAFFGIVLGLSAVFINDAAAVRQHGFFQGYNNFTWAVIFLQAFGGLIVALVVKYADNILKAFATSISIIVSSVVSLYFLNDFELTRQFVAGTSAVLLATYMYSKPST